MFFNKETGRVMGLSTLIEDFDLDGGEMLVFEYFGGSIFYVYIIGRDSTEIDYPPIVHSSQKTKPRTGTFFSILRFLFFFTNWYNHVVVFNLLEVSMRNGGLRFVKFVTEKEDLSDDIVSITLISLLIIFPWLR